MRTKDTEKFLPRGYEYLSNHEDKAMNGLLETQPSLDDLLLDLERSSRNPSLSSEPMLRSWLAAQAINVSRHAKALRPFQEQEFGTDAASPSRAHLISANQLIRQLRSQLLRVAQQVEASANAAIQHPSSDQIQPMLANKQQAQAWVKLVEKVWDFYLEIFSQRQTRFGKWLLGADRIALDCYQVIYTHLGVAKPIPTPGPFSYMETGFSPATFRRGIPLSLIGKQINPFPLIQLPYHRLVNPWTLGAILHEVSHDLQTDLNLRQTVPRAIASCLLNAGMSPLVVKTWCRWHSEIWADLNGLLLGGAVMLASLMDIAGRSQEATLFFQAKKPHPTPYLRIFINIELLRRMGFSRQAKAYKQLWQRLYPNPRAGNIPSEILSSFSEAKRLVVDTLCFQPYEELGGITLFQATGKFQPKHQQMIREAGQRLAQGNDPGIIPERFLIGASRWTLDQRLTEPGRITRNFYQALGRR
ncbi:MAG: hypothetical protein AB4038_09460 [Prochloraceae cyanobacterium]